MIWISRFEMGSQEARGALCCVFMPIEELCSDPQAVDWLMAPTKSVSKLNTRREVSSCPMKLWRKLNGAPIWADVEELEDKLWFGMKRHLNLELRFSMWVKGHNS